LQKKRSRRISTKYKHKYSDSSFESDSYSHDDAEGGAIKHRHAKKEKNKNKGYNETETKLNSRKEDEDDQSVSDDSLEVIVVKRSLEKKCEKVVSGRRSKTPRECKETKLTKTHKSSSKKMSRSSKSNIFDKDENTDQDESPDKKEKRVTIEKPAHTSEEEKEDGSEKIIESRFRRDATDSTSQETVERVVVTAMVHKDHIPDTPRSTQETTKEMSSDNVLRKKTIVIEETKETSKDISSSDKSKTALSHKTDTHDTSEERLQRITQESLVNEEIQNKDEKVKLTMPSMEDVKEGTNNKNNKIHTKFQHNHFFIK